jgi:Ca2+-binding EF-hand superfamily protein
MGASASVELSKPKDASDLEDFDSAKAEVVRLRAALADEAAKQQATPAVAEAVAIEAVAVATAVATPVETWAKAVFGQFDTNADGKIDTTELKRAIKSLPIIVPRNKEEADAMASSVNDMIDSMDANGDGSITEDEWLANLRACPHLHKQIEAAVGEGGTVTNFRDFGEQLEKRENEVAALEAKESRSEDEENELASYKKQIEGLKKRIDDRNKNLFKVAEWGKSVFTQFDTDKNGKLDKKELNEALRSLPRTKPKYAPKDTKFMSIGDMVTSMDSDGDGQVNLEEWLDGISKCAGLCAALMENQVDGKIHAFKSLSIRKAAAEAAVAALEGKEGRTEEEEMELQEKQQLVATLTKKIDAADAADALTTSASAPTSA